MTNNVYNDSVFYFSIIIIYFIYNNSQVWLPISTLLLQLPLWLEQPPPLHQLDLWSHVISKSAATKFCPLPMLHATLSLLDQTTVMLHKLLKNNGPASVSQTIPTSNYLVACPRKCSPVDWMVKCNGILTVKTQTCKIKEPSWWTVKKSSKLTKLSCPRSNPRTETTKSTLDSLWPQPKVTKWQWDSEQRSWTSSTTLWFKEPPVIPRKAALMSAVRVSSPRSAAPLSIWLMETQSPKVQKSCTLASIDPLFQLIWLWTSLVWTLTWPVLSEVEPWRSLPPPLPSVLFSSPLFEALSELLELKLFKILIYNK